MTHLPGDLYAIYLFFQGEGINLFVKHIYWSFTVCAQGLFIRKNSKNEITVCALEGLRIQLREVSHILMWEHTHYFLWSNANWCNISCTVVERSARRQSLPLSLKLWKNWITCMSSAQGKDLLYFPYISTILDTILDPVLSIWQKCNKCVCN